MRPAGSSFAIVASTLACAAAIGAACGEGGSETAAGSNGGSAQAGPAAGSAGEGAGAMGGYGGACADCCPPTGDEHRCNPFTNAGCDEHETCDLGDGFAFECFPQPAAVEEHCACNPALGPWCALGTTCMTDERFESGTCQRYCCSEADCGGAGCTLFEGMPIGFCDGESRCPGSGGAGGGAGGSGGAGGVGGSGGD
jgi:hypothetical protein